MRPEVYPPSYELYISKVPDGDISEILTRQGDQIKASLSHIPEVRGAHRYAPGKWSVRQVIGHISDTERIMTYRMLHIGRGDPAPLSGFDENLFARNARFDQMSIAALSEDLLAVRAATVSLVNQFDESDFRRTGVVSGHPCSILGLAFMVAGHFRHHLEILREKYSIEV